MTFNDIITRVCNRLNKNVNDTTVTTRIKNEINDACQEKWEGYAWSFRWREYPLVLSPQVQESTATATNGSQTVTTTDTPFIDPTHVGQWIRFTADSTQAWYRILKVVSTSQITIEPAYQGTTGSTKNFQLSVTDYDIPMDITGFSRLKITIDARPLEIQHQLMQDGYFQPPLSAGVPYGASLFTNDFKPYTYTTGTVTGTSGTTTLTGSGTSWLTNILPGDEISGLSGDSNTYRVRYVDSDTNMVLVNNLTTSPSGSTYTRTRQYQIIARVQPAPDKAYVCTIKGLRRYNPLVNTADTNELILRFPYAVIESAVWREASSSPDTREDSLYQKAERLWQEAQSQDAEISQQTNYQPIFDPRNSYR